MGTRAAGRWTGPSGEGTGILKVDYNKKKKIIIYIYRVPGCGGTRGSESLHTRFTRLHRSDMVGDERIASPTRPSEPLGARSMAGTTGTGSQPGAWVARLMIASHSAHQRRQLGTCSGTNGAVGTDVPGTDHRTEWDHGDFLRICSTQRAHFLLESHVSSLQPPLCLRCPQMEGAMTAVIPTFGIRTGAMHAQAVSTHSPHSRAWPCAGATSGAICAATTHARARIHHHCFHHHRHHPYR